MHLLLIILVLVFTFPLLARIAGSILSIVFWLVVAGTVVAIVEVAFQSTRSIGFGSMSSVSDSEFRHTAVAKNLGLNEGVTAPV